jgi:hypothetical protein
MSQTRLIPVAAPTGPVAQAERSNTALDLAQSLSGVNAALQQFSGPLIAQKQQEQATKGRAAAQSAQGLAFADAVRDGRIKPTQNPFFISAFDRESAAINGRQSLTQLQIDSLNWPERSDPVAFQQRWNKEVSQLSAQFTNADQIEGFQAVNAEVSSQVINGNTAQEAKRIVDARTANAGALIAQKVGDINRSFGGSAPTAAFSEGVAELREDFINTGGSVEEFDQLFLAGVTTAAFSTQNPDLFNALKAPLEEGATPIFNRPGVADQVDNDVFRIESNHRRKLTEGEELDNIQLRQRGRQAKDTILTSFGKRFLIGEIGPDQVIADLESKGFSAPEIGVALQELQNIFAASNAWSRAITGTGDGGDAQSFDLFLDASQNGSSDALTESVRRELAAGTIAATDARTIINEAQQADERLGKAPTLNGATVIDSQTTLNNRLKDISVLGLRETDEIRERFAGVATQKGITIPFFDDALLQDRIQASAAAVMAGDKPSFTDAFNAARAEEAVAVKEYIDQLIALGIVAPRQPSSLSPVAPVSTRLRPR